MTFLLSDIEGSTRHWEAAPDAMPEAVRLHYRLLAEVVAARGGVRPVEQGEGDSIVAAFARASDALVAAVEAQRALDAADWPDQARLTVRIALHTAEAQLRDEGNYFGVALSRCARLRAVARGGQIVLSRATHDLTVDRVPLGVDLVDCGLHRLRDLGRPEQVFVVADPELDGGLLPLQSLDSFPNNLPSQLTSFIGREADLAAVAEALAGTRLLTLTGAGGCGKTRIAAQSAADALDRFPDGAWWVELAPISDEDQVAAALASALAVRPLPGQTPLEAVVGHLADRRALVVLDNCEHLLADAARVADAVLRGCPAVTVLTTSRAPLGLAGETDWRVPSLSLPSIRDLEPIDALAQSDAVRLFIERAMKVRPNFAVTNDNAPAVAAICVALDGIPLAIELAAARTRVLTPEQIAAGLGDVFHLLTGGARSSLPRHQTLRGCIEWSHDLLDERERILLRRLGVFEGGFTLDAAEAVCSGDGLTALDVLDLLTSLVEKSLVLADEDGRTIRYRMLETVRQYASERLHETGEIDDARDRHCAHVAAFVGGLAPGLITSRQRELFLALDAEAANIAAALRHAAVTDPRLGLRLAADLTFWWKLRGRFEEADSAYAAALAAADGDADPALRAEVMWGRAYLKTYAGDYEGSVVIGTEALDLATQAGATTVVARVLDTLGTLQLFGDPVGALPVLEQSRELARAAGDDFCWIDATQIAAFCLVWCERYDEALAVLGEATDAIARLGHQEFAAWEVIGRGMAATVRDPVPAARSMHDDLVAAVDGDVAEPVTRCVAQATTVWLDAVAGNVDGGVERIAGVRRFAIARGAGMALAWITNADGLIRFAAGDLSGAHAVLSQAAEQECNGDALAYCHVLPLLAEVQRLRGETAAAETTLATCDAVLERTGARVRRAETRLTRARLRIDAGDWTAADTEIHGALEDLTETRARVYVPTALELLADVACGVESWAEASRLLGAADAGRAEMGTRRFPPHEQRVAGLRTALAEAQGEAEATTAEREGAELSLDEAVAWARRARGVRKRPSGGWESLTPTELRVVELAAEGLTNPQISERMFITRGTVKVHLSHVYAKLDVRNRSELTALVVRRAPR